MTEAEKPLLTQEQHSKLVAAEVLSETASLNSAIETLEAEVASLKAANEALAQEKADQAAAAELLEVAKAAAEKAAADAAKEFEDFKNAQAEKAAAALRKEERLAAVKAAVDLDESFYTEARVQSWAELSEEDFASRVADLTEAAKMSKKAPKPADQNDGDADDVGDKTKVQEQARETAAFSGGGEPSSKNTVSVRSLFTEAGFFGSNK